MKEAQPSLLIVEDDLDIAEMLDSYFRMQGYRVRVANWGEDGVNACLAELPDLVILDIRLPDIDGFEVATRLRSNRRTRHLPIIFLTEKRDRTDRLQGLSLRAEDYITKPFDVQELRLRVNNVLARNRRSSLTQPVTGLPEGALVDEQLNKYLIRQNLALSVISLKNLGRFREVYGFVASDDLLRAMSRMLEETLRDLAAPETFLGHLTPTSFLLLCRPADLPTLKEEIGKRLAPSLDYFYRDQDLEKGLFAGSRMSIDVRLYHPDSEPPATVQQLRAALERLP